MGTIKYKYATLRNYVLSSPLSIEGALDDAWGASFAVKGVETMAAILFADMSGFTGETQDLSPTETLILVNNFLAWVTAEGLRGGPGIVDKYVGDEVMVVFSPDFGSEDPFRDALNAARWMAERDALSFCPHMGIAYGPVTCGFVGTPLKYDCSVYGAPVAMAKRCASVARTGVTGVSIVFPEELWRGRSFESIFTPLKYAGPDGEALEADIPWECCPPRVEALRNLEDVEIREIRAMRMHLPSLSATERARLSLELLRKAGRYHSRFESP